MTWIYKSQPCASALPCLLLAELPSYEGSDSDRENEDWIMIVYSLVVVSIFMGFESVFSRVEDMSSRSFIALASIIHASPVRGLATYIFHRDPFAERGWRPDLAVRRQQ